ncbi:hypothetical protein LC607_32865 [Nostoc sp. CHAB 5824]|nr:hypothetical protein [Nostoc sp. CHAB 5824]
MGTSLSEQGLLLLRQALDNSTSDFRPGQWEAIEGLLKERSHFFLVLDIMMMSQEIFLFW